MNKQLLFISIFLLGFNIINAQNKYPQNIFREPMELPIELSGSFSELRTNSFHTGLDIRVIGRNHRRVYAIGDGYISRIKVEASGYGNALYITHPQGYVSVYAHLDRFKSEISDFVKQIQYELKSFSIDTLLTDSVFKISKGEVIGIAGNTGYSFGPHLHFEIRNAKTEEAIAPNEFGIKIADNRFPEFKEVKIYTHGNSLINNKNEDIILKPTKLQNNKYVINTKPTISGYISLGFDVEDKQNNTNPNRLGLKSLQVFVNDTLLIHTNFNILNFLTVRHMLSYIDFAEREKSKKRFQRTYLEPGNKSPIYKFVENNGLIAIKENKQYNIRCLITDIGDNTSELNFSFYGKNTDNIFHINNKCEQNKTIFKWDTTNVYLKNQISIFADTGVFFNDICLDISTSDSNISSFAPILQINNNEPLAKPYTIYFFSPDSIKNAVIASISKKNKLKAFPTYYKNNVYSANIREFGTFILTQDTIPPSITPQNIPNSGNVANLKELTFNIKDDISSIASYNGYINDEWILFEYDLKNDKLFYKKDEKLPKGTSVLKIEVSDKAGNKNTWQKTIIN